MDKIKNSFFETVGRWVLCNEGFGSAFFFYKAGEIREMKDALAVISGRTDVFLYLRIVEILYFIVLHFRTAMEGWVEEKLVSQVISLSVQMTELKNTNQLWGMEDLRQITCM